METTNSNQNSSSDSNPNLLERDFSRGFLAGCIIVVGFALAALFQHYLFVEPYNLTTDIIITFIVPVATIYFFSRFVTYILQKYGFDGFHKGEKLTILKISGVLFGALVTGFGLLVGTLLFDNLGRLIETNENIDDGFFIAWLFIIGLLYILYRRSNST